MCNVSKYIDCETLQDVLRDLLKQNASNEQNNFCRLNLDVHMKKSGLVKYLNDLGIETDNVANRCGIMVMSNYRNKGYASYLVAESDKLLVSKEIKACIVRTSSEASHRLFKRNNYILWSHVDYKDFGITSADEPKHYILYKIF